MSKYFDFKLHMWSFDYSMCKQRIKSFIISVLFHFVVIIEKFSKNIMFLIDELKKNNDASYDFKL